MNSNVFVWTYDNFINSFIVDFQIRSATSFGSGPLGIWEDVDRSFYMLPSIIVVVGKKENIQRIVDALQEMQAVMREIAGQILSGGFSLLDKSYQELKEDYLVLAITVVDIVDGAVYLFEKEPPSKRRNWKAELELEQFRRVLEVDEEDEDVIEKKGMFMI